MTILSMTGFAVLETNLASATLIVELRSVNHRYLELQLKLDDNLRAFEPSIREMLTSKLGRGKVECRMSLVKKAEFQQQASLNQQVLEQLSELVQQVKSAMPESAPISISEVLRWPGMLNNSEANQEALAEKVHATLEQTITQMTDSRAREGEKLGANILQRVAEMQILVDNVRPLLPMQVKAYREKLLGKLQETMQSLEEDRIRQELVIFAQKIDVDEELTRLNTHLQEVQRVIKTGGIVGKRLDFLMQELNREANTLGSKSVSTEVSQTSMNLKILIEQMREQIQNIE